MDRRTSAGGRSTAVNATRLFLRPDASSILAHVRNARSTTTHTSFELRQQVALRCAQLREAGVRAGDRVLILCSSRVEAVEALLAVMNIGATAMPVSPLLGAQQLLAIAGAMTPRCCLFEDAPEDSVGATLRNSGCVCLPLLGELSMAAPSQTRPSYEEFPDSQPALVIHSSGSSGRPKAVLMSHGDLVRFFEYHDLVWRQYADAPDSLVASSAMVTGLPLSHLAGISICLQGLLNGRPTYLMSYFLPEPYLRLIEEARCACMLLVPSLYRSLLKEPYLAKMDRSALRCCIVGGEACPEDLLREMERGFGVPAATAYSMTECLSGIGHSRRELFAGSIKRGSCGRQLFGESSLRDEEGRQQESVGELWVRNATVHRCYLDEQLNEQRLRDGWFRTGDIFYRDEAGDFFHRGRVDDMFVCNGKNIYPVELEQLLMSHPAVEAACAAAVSCPRRGPVPAALIVARSPLTGAAIQEYAMRHGPSHTVPQFVKLIDALPNLGPGKLDRRKAAQLLQDAFNSERV